MLAKYLNHLLSSSYLHCGCTVVKLILKMFGPVIKENMQAPTGHGIDINREERYTLCLIVI